MHILLNWILQGAIVAAATAGGLRVLRGAPAATRHAVCWTTLVAILVLPFVPSLWSLVMTLRPVPPAPTAALELPGASPGWDPLVRLPAMVSVTSALLGAAWMLWTMLQAVRVVRDVRWLRRARRRCRALPAAISARLSPATLRLVRATRARVVLCDVIRAAAVLGGGQPVIGLQRRLVNELSDSELNAVLVHELTHVVRRDSMATVVQRSVHVLVGWHPGIWWVMRRLALEREMACDEAALAAAGGPRAYATCLTRIAALAQGSALSSYLALGMLQASGLRRRIVHVLTPGRFSRRTAGWASGTLSMSLSVLAISVGTVVVFGEPAVAERVDVGETATSRLVRPLPDSPPAPLVPNRPRPAATAQRRGARTIVSDGVQPVADIAETTATVVVSPVARRQDRNGPVSGAVPASAEPAPVAAAENVAAAPAPTETTPPAASPASTPGSHDPTVTDAAVAAAAGAADAWNVTAGAAAKSGAAVGRTTQKSAVSTAGAFTRWGRRIASSF